MAERALDESRRYRERVTAKVMAANHDLGRRIRDGGMEIDYLPEEDRLYVSFGSARPSEAISLGDGTHAVLLLDPANYEITGVDAPFFMEDYQALEAKPEIWRVIVDLIQNRGNYIYIPGAEEAERAEKAMSALIPLGA